MLSTHTHTIIRLQDTKEKNLHKIYLSTNDMCTFNNHKTKKKSSKKVNNCAFSISTRELREIKKEEEEDKNNHNLGFFSKFF